MRPALLHCQVLECLWVSSTAAATRNLLFYNVITGADRSSVSTFFSLTDEKTLSLGCSSCSSSSSRTLSWAVTALASADDAVAPDAATAVDVADVVDVPAAAAALLSFPNPLSLLPWWSRLPEGGNVGGGSSGNGHGDVMERRGGLRAPATGRCRYMGWMVAGAVAGEEAEGVAPTPLAPEGTPVAEEAAEETPEEDDPPSAPLPPLPGELAAGSRLGCSPR